MTIQEIFEGFNVQCWLNSEHVYLNWIKAIVSRLLYKNAVLTVLKLSVWFGLVFFKKQN